MGSRLFKVAARVTFDRLTSGINQTLARAPSGEALAVTEERHLDAEIKAFRDGRFAICSLP